MRIIQHVSNDVA